MKYQSDLESHLRRPGTTGFIRFSVIGLVLAGLAAGFSAPARAESINYLIENNGGLIEPFQNQPVSISGGFTYDTATGVFSTFNVVLTTALGFGGTYTEDGSPLLITGLGQPELIFAGTGGVIELFFNGFGGRDDHEIRFVNVKGDNDFTLLPADARNRPSILPSLGTEGPAIPEPSTLVFALTGGALGLLGLRPPGAGRRSAP